MNIDEIETRIEEIEKTISKIKELVADMKVCSSDITKALINSALKKYMAMMPDTKTSTGENT